MIVHSEDGGETQGRQEMNWEALAVRSFTQDSPTQKQQVIDPKQDLNANILSKLEQSRLHRRLRKKDFDFTQKQVNAPPRTAAFAF